MSDIPKFHGPIAPPSFVAVLILTYTFDMRFLGTGAESTLTTLTNILAVELPLTVPRSNTIDPVDADVIIEGVNGITLPAVVAVPLIVDPLVATKIKFLSMIVCVILPEYGNCELPVADIVAVPSAAKVTSNSS